jgi:hypothetical protein
MNLEKKIMWSKVKDNPDYTCGLDIYKRHYFHLSRGQLQKENSALYCQITREGNLKQVSHKYYAWAKKEKISELLTQIYKINKTKDYLEKLEEESKEEIKRGKGPLIIELLN